MHVPLGGAVRGTMGIKLATYQRPEDQSGADVILDGVRFTLDLTGDGRAQRQSDVGAVRVHRPSGLWFDHSGTTTFHLAFEWGNRANHAHSVVLEVM